MNDKTENIDAERAKRLAAAQKRYRVRRAAGLVGTPIERPPKPIRFPDELAACAHVAKAVRYQDNDIVWAVTQQKANIGKLAGKLAPTGYRRIHLHDYGFLQVHRVIFFMFHGYLPYMVDHIDGNPRNNSIENLRAATHAQNAANCKTSVKNTSGRKGVHWHKTINRWTASIRTNNKLKHLGTFETFAEAVAAREQAEREIHGEFTRN